MCVPSTKSIFTFYDFKDISLKLETLYWPLAFLEITIGLQGNSQAVIPLGAYIKVC